MIFNELHNQEIDKKKTNISKYFVENFIEIISVFWRQTNLNN
jgi:hypothetical protein